MTWTGESVIVTVNPPRARTFCLVVTEEGAQETGNTLPLSRRALFVIMPSTRHCTLETCLQFYEGPLVLARSGLLVTCSRPCKKLASSKQLLLLAGGWRIPKKTKWKRYVRTFIDLSWSFVGLGVSHALSRSHPLFCNVERTLQHRRISATGDRQDNRQVYVQSFDACCQTDWGCWHRRNHSASRSSGSSRAAVSEREGD